MLLLESDRAAAVAEYLRQAAAQGDEEAAATLRRKKPPPHCSRLGRRRSRSAYKRHELGGLLTEEAYMLAGRRKRPTTRSGRSR